MKHAYGYTRVSTILQASDGTSLSAQEAKIRAWCSANDYELADVLVDRGLSGGRADNRPSLQEALSRVRRGDALVVYSLSRLARSTRDTLAIADLLDKRAADLVSLSEKIDTTNAAGRMVFRLLAVLAEFEKDTIGERTSMTMCHLRSQHRYLGGHAPYGWSREGDNVTPVQSEQAAMGVISLMRREGNSLRGISQTLAGQGILNRLGRPLAASQIRRMLLSREAEVQAESDVSVA